MITIATGDGKSSHFETRPSLDGTSYILEFDWNDRDQSWYMNLWDTDKVKLYFANERLVVNWSLGTYNTRFGLPGSLFVYDTSGTEREMEFADLGDRVVLLYFTATDLGR